MNTNSMQKNRGGVSSLKYIRDVIFLSFIFNLWTGYVFAWQSPYPSHTRVIINKHKNINGELIVHNPGNKVWQRSLGWKMKKEHFQELFCHR